MFSYRHAFHAGNHADVLKHMVLIAIVRHLTQKDAPLAVFDTHAGAGLYRLDSDYANTSGEAAQGYLRLVKGGAAVTTPGAVAGRSQAKSADTTECPQPWLRQAPRGGARKLGNGPAFSCEGALAPVLQDYLDMVATFNAKGSCKVYPGSPFIIQRLLRDRDKLKLFELHPTDAKTLSANIAQLDAGRQVTVSREDGFEALKKFLPPPQRRALVLCDPSYEIKNDYQRVSATMADAMARFATGTYAIWYPIIPRPEAHDLPRKLKSLANKVGKPWLNASLSVKSSKMLVDTTSGTQTRPGLPASGIFVINPPHTLKAALQLALPQLVQALAQDRHVNFGLEAGG